METIPVWRSSSHAPRSRLVLCHAQPGNDDFRVVGETKSISAVGRGQLSWRDYGGPIVAGDHGSVDGALDARGRHGNGDLLGDGLSRSSSFMYSLACLT